MHFNFCLNRVRLKSFLFLLSVNFINIKYCFELCFILIKMEPELIKSNKGHDKLFFDGFGYHFRSKTKSGVYRWCCEKRKNLLCKSVVFTKFDNKHVIYKEPSRHNHDSDVKEKSVSEANQNLKDLARNSALNPSQIIREITVQTDVIVRPCLPSKSAQVKKIQRTRVGADFINEPQNLDAINIPNNLKYLDGELFVLSEKTFDSGVIIILGTKTSLQALGEAKCWIMDGTFYVVPSIMRQLFTIHGVIGGQIMPLIFCLMSEKTSKAYNEVFYELCKISVEENVNLNPERIISDFEITISNVAKDYFRQAEFKGCLFHFGQIIWRRIQKEGLSKKYGSNSEFCIHMKMLKSLAFVPPCEVINYFKELKSYSEDSDFKKMCTWFQNTYIQRPKDLKPKYSPEFWSVEDAFKNNFPRTQNSAEAWHRRLKVVVGRKNAGLYKIIEELAKELVMSKTLLEKIRNGECFKKKNKKWNNIKN